jgi:hypothetical protein
MGISFAALDLIAQPNVAEPSGVPAPAKFNTNDRDRKSRHRREG